MSIGAAAAAALAYYVVLRLERPRFERVHEAVCVFGPTDDGVSGTIVMSRSAERRTIFECDVRGLAPGLHGFHVHESGDLRDGCKSACAHYNPEGHVHGGATDAKRHRGDLGNLRADAKGNCNQRIEAAVDLDEILGRMLVVHADPDDLGRGGHSDSLTTGHSGRRIACGVIARVSCNA